MSDYFRVIFAGTPAFAAQHLNALLSSRHQVVGVFTQPDRPSGRKQQLTSSPVKVVAEQNHVAVFQPENLHSAESTKIITRLQPDIIIVVAYGLILPKTILTLPRFGCINVHGSLLPRWRGAAPIQRALWAGDKKTGITIMQMDAGLDTGDMLYNVSCSIAPDETSATLYNKLAQLGPEALLNTLDLIAQGKVRADPQNEELVTYAEKLNKKEAQLNWNLSAIQLERCIRAFNPWPGSYFILANQYIKVWQAQALPAINATPQGTIIRADKNGIQIATADGILNITHLQPAGKNTMPASDFLHSRRELLIPGQRLA